LLQEAFAFGLVTSSVLALTGVGFTIQFAVTGFFNLTYGQVMTASAFVAYTMNVAGMNIWLALPLAALFGGVLSVVINRSIFSPFLNRGSGPFVLLIVTMAVGLIIENIILAVGGITFFSFDMNSEVAYRILGMPFTSAQLVIVGLALASMVGLHALLAYTKLGRAMRATASNASLARSCGINTKTHIDVAWLISGTLCGLGGVILAIQIGTFQSTTGAAFVPMVVAAAMLGGVGQPYGGMLGALIVGMTSEISGAFIDPSYKTLVALAVLVIVILFRPQGIIGSVAAHQATL
jgi:branched-subunit amino acid ABC-type transport system permease component